MIDRAELGDVQFTSPRSTYEMTATGTGISWSQMDLSVILETLSSSQWELLMSQLTFSNVQRDV